MARKTTWIAVVTTPILLLFLMRQPLSFLLFSLIYKNNSSDKASHHDLFLSCNESSLDQNFANYKATKAICEIIDNYSGKSNVCFISDYDGSRISQNNFMNYTTKVIDEYQLDPRVFQTSVFENRNAFFYFLALIEAQGYNSGLLLGRNSNSERANNLAARISQCIKQNWQSSTIQHQIEYSWCLNGMLTGLPHTLLLSLLKAFYETIPKFQPQYKFAIQSQNLLAVNGIKVIVQSGSFDAMVIAQALFNPGPANNVLLTDECVSGSNACPILADSSSINANGLHTFTPKTDNVCDNFAFFKKSNDSCVDHAAGKVSGYYTIKKRFQCEQVVGIHLNSNNDDAVGMTAVNEGALMFSNDNKALCEKINKETKSCFDITNAKDEISVSSLVDMNVMKTIKQKSDELGLKRQEDTKTFSTTIKSAFRLSHALLFGKNDGISSSDSKHRIFNSFR